MDEQGLAEIAALARAAAERSGHEALSETRLLELGLAARGGTVPGFAALFLRAGDSGALAGYGQLCRGPSGWDVEVVTDPDVDAAPLREPLLRHALHLAAEAGGGALQLFVPRAGDADDRLAAAVGLDAGRELHQMRRPLPLDAALAALADKVAVRGFRTGEDEAAFLALNNAAFSSHPDQGNWDEATLAEREAQPWFDPDGLLLAEDGDRLAGFCWTKIDPEAARTGEIYVLGVAPGSQGAGLGAALLAAGCRYLSGRGATTVTLYVDGDNEPARRLYASAGFVVDHRDRVYLGTIPAAGGARS